MAGKVPARSQSSRTKSAPLAIEPRKDGVARSASSRQSQRPARLPPLPTPHARDRGRLRLPSAAITAPSSPSSPVLPSRRPHSHESQHRQRPSSSTSDGFEENTRRLRAQTSQSSHRRPSSQQVGQPSLHDITPGLNTARLQSPRAQRERPPLSTWGRRDSSSHSSPYYTSPRNASPRRSPTSEKHTESAREQEDVARSRHKTGAHHPYSEARHRDTLGSYQKIGMRGRSPSTRYYPSRLPSINGDHDKWNETSKSPLRKSSDRHSPRSSLSCQRLPDDRHRYRSESYRSPTSSPVTYGGTEDVKDFFSRLPGRFITYAGFRTIGNNADKAKEWIDYLQDLGGTPSEIHDLSAKACTARDTLHQIEQTIHARPDLLDGQSGQRLRNQIEETCRGAGETLKGLTRMLSELSEDGSEESTGRGTLRRELEDYWKSHRYKSQFEEKVRDADEQLQKELQQLSTLMVNVYSRALRKPAPSGSASIPPPAPQAAGLGQDSRAGISTDELPSAPVMHSQDLPQHSQAKIGSEDQSQASTTFQHHQKAPVIEVQPPTQSTSDGHEDVNLGSPTMTSPHDATFPQCSPLLTPDGIASNNPEDDCESVGDGLLPLQTDQKVSVSPAPIWHKHPTTGPLDNERPSTTGSSERKVPQQGASPQGATEQFASERNDSVVSPTTVVQDPPHQPLQPRQGQPPQAGSQVPPIPTVQDDDFIHQAKEMLLDACWDGDIDKVTRALRVTSPATTFDSHGLTPLHLACERDHLAIAILLVDRGAPLNPQPIRSGLVTPLHLACRYASAPTVEMLLEHRSTVDPNAQTREGRTPLHFAASVAADNDEERREVIRLLRDWGADPLVVDATGQTARDVAQGRGFWRAAGTLRRMEKRREEPPGEQVPPPPSPRSTPITTSTCLPAAEGAGDRRNEHIGKRGNWLQRHGFMKV